MSLVPVYRRRASALHATRAGAAACFCVSFALVALLYRHPLVLGAALLAIVAAGVAASVGGEVWRAVRLALPLALLIAVINALVYQEGDTLLLRGGEILGRRFDVTLESLLAGCLAAMRITVLIAAFGLLSAAVDPDDLLKLFRRVSYRSALTASLATRLVPVLARDASRMSDAARCRPVAPGRLASVRAALTGALDRAVDVAAALEVRGYSAAVRPARSPRPWSRHDLSAAAAALVVASGAIAAKVAGAGAVVSYPSFSAAAGGLELGLCALLLCASLVPFAGRSARLGVARA